MNALIQIEHDVEDNIEWYIMNPIYVLNSINEAIYMIKPSDVELFYYYFILFCI